MISNTYNIQALPNSKVWVYQSSRELSNPEIEFCNHKLAEFSNGWNSHGKPLSVQTYLILNRFILFVVDENIASVSGCSIDKSVNFLSELGKYLNTDFMNRDLIYEFDSKLELVKLANIKQKIETKEINKDTQIFNLNISNFADFNSSFKINASQSWLKRYFI